jgi:AraC-like DNA-binding protein
LEHFQRQSLEFAGRRPPGFSSIMFSETQRFAFEGGAGRLTTDQIRLGTSGIRVSRVRSTGHRISLSENRDVTFLFPRAGSLAIRVAGREVRVAENDASFFRPQSRDTRAERPRTRDYEGHVLMLPMSDVDALAEAAGARPFLGADVLPVKGAAAQRLSDYLAFLLSDLDRPDRPPPSDRVVAGMAALVRDLLSDWLTETPPEPGWHRPPGPGPEAARVRRAEEIMRARADEPLTVADLARDVGLSLRSLQLAFQTVHGEGPRARLTRIRLERARARLLQAEPPEQVTTVALDCGFTHLSRFAEAYLRTFGERPSETLARRGRPSPRR